MRNKLILTALILVIPFLLTACTLKDIPVVGKFFGGGGLSLGGPVTLNVWGLWENPEVMQQIVAKYKETHPNVNINYDDRSVLGASQYKETLLGRIGQPEVADIVLVHNSWVQDIKGSLAPAPSKIMSEQQYAEKYYPIAKDSAVFDGNVYAVPMYHDGIVLVYNKKHFEEEGQQSPPTSWEEFRRLAFNLTKRDEKGEIIRAGAAMGTANNIDFFSDILGTFFAQAKVNVPQDLDGKPARDALAFYVLFSKSDKGWDNTFPEASAAFAQERVSMIFIPSWNLLDILRERPNLQIGVAPVPQAKLDNPVSWASFWMYAVPAVSPNKEAAWEFINYLAQEDTQRALFDAAARQRVYGAPFSLVSLKDQVASGPYGNYLKPLLDSAAFAQSSRFAARAGNDLYVAALKEAVNSVLNSREDITVASEAALKKAKATIVSGGKQ
ncbi:MAG: sugar ABC transporter substrate-binding protein [Patescibacteria group bacterium]|nr:MAG: sugar ABC transporter substrate-binding protein [Patescibacteria group bacterium]